VLKKVNKYNQELQTNIYNIPVHTVKPV